MTVSVQLYCYGLQLQRCVRSMDGDRRRIHGTHTVPGGYCSIHATAVSFRQQLQSSLDWFDELSVDAVWSESPSSIHNTHVVHGAGIDACSRFSTQLAANSIHCSWSKAVFSLCVCVCVNQGGANHIRYVRGRQYTCDDDVIEAVEEFLADQDTAFYQAAIEMLQKRWTKCIDVHGDNVEK